MIEQAAGRRDQHIDAARDLGVLIGEGDAADQQGDVEFLVRAVFDEGFLDLRREFARRFEDERARHARPGAALLEDREHRQREGGGLARAGLRDAQDVLAFKDVGDCLFLDRSRLRVAGGTDRVDHSLGEA
jgi:hypothetical protein